VPTELKFTRNLEVTYKGVTYDKQQPIYTTNGVRVNADEGERLETSEDVVLTTEEGQIELTFTPVSSSFTVLSADVTGGVFELASAINNKLRFTFGDGSHFIESKSNIYSNQPLTVILKWSTKSNLYEIWIDGDYAGHITFGGDYWSDSYPSSFNSAVKIGTQGSIVLMGIQFSTVARAVR
jgi:hypothetical protein